VLNPEPPYVPALLKCGLQEPRCSPHRRDVRRQTASACRFQNAGKQEGRQGRATDELLNPALDALVAGLNATLAQEFPDSAVAQREAHIEPNSVPDDLGWGTGGVRRRRSAALLPYPQSLIRHPCRDKARPISLGQSPMLFAAEVASQTT
jgi:hypothetical protein